MRYVPVIFASEKSKCWNHPVILPQSSSGEIGKCDILAALIRKIYNQPQLNNAWNKVTIHSFDGHKADLVFWIKIQNHTLEYAIGHLVQTPVY